MLVQHICSSGTYHPLQPVGHLLSKRRGHRLRVSCMTPQQEMATKIPAELPRKYKRLIGQKTGKDFRSVAEVEECDMTEPGEGQVSPQC